MLSASRRALSVNNGGLLSATRPVLGGRALEGRTVRFADGHKLSGAKYYLKYSRPGPFSTYSFRMRYPVFHRQITDSAICDFMTNKAIGAWFAEFPSYNYYFGAWLSFVASILFVLRHAMFNPDITCRHNEKRLPLPDRLRQWSYALPYYNCRIKNWSLKFNWMLCQNEPDWKDISWMGCRPNRDQCHRVCMVWNCFHPFVPRYKMECPYITTCSNMNMSKIYHDMGYKKCPEFFDDAEAE